jgi:hypothetical protein
LGWLGCAFSSELSHFRPSIVALNPTYAATILTCKLGIFVHVYDTLSH